MKNKNFWIGSAAVIAALVLLGWRNFSNWGRSGEQVPCINPALPIPANLHIHPNLKIVVNGEEVRVPASIGNGVGCERVIHMHDETGEIHIEPNFPKDFTLGDFFWVWQKPFSKDRLFEYRVDDAHEIVMTVDGQPNTAYETLVLKDGQQIVLEYRQKN